MVDDSLNDIDIKDIARGRRITAVTASELQMTPRNSSRPEPKSGVVVLVKRLFSKRTRIFPNAEG